MADLFQAALRDGSVVELRSLEADDRERLVRLFYRLSPQAVYRRFLSPIHDPSEVGLDRLLDLDHREREAIAAIAGGEIVGVARYFRNSANDTADLAVVVEDGWQEKGLAAILVERLRELAASRGIAGFTATILSENRPAMRLVRRLFPNAELTFEGTETNALLAFEPSLR